MGRIAQKWTITDIIRSVGEGSVNSVTKNIGRHYEEEALVALYKPILARHNFQVDRKGRVVLYYGTCGLTIRRGITTEHRNMYLTCVYVKLDAHEALIQRNLKANKNYERPTFEIEVAQRIAREAFQESFQKTKDSYTLSTS